MIEYVTNRAASLWSVIWLVAGSFLLSACGSEISSQETEDGEFAVTLYDKESNVVHTEIYPKLSWIAEMTDNILQIGLTGGNISSLIFYYDKERAIVSPFYTESFYLRDNNVAYMEDEEELVFDELDEIEKNYEILQYDICSPVQYDFEDINPVVKKHIEYELSNNEELSQKYGRELKIAMDYHTFDFDDDGLIDYLVCIDRELYDGRVEHWIEIYIARQERGWIGHEREMVEEMAYGRLELNLPLYNQVEEDGHKQIMVLDEQIDGYYTIVLPGSNLILRYNDLYNKYEFCDQ